MEINMSIANIIFIAGMLILLLSVAKTFVDLISSTLDSSITKSRLKQLLEKEFKSTMQ